MKMIVGLGNPGKEYEKTRHNAGFMVIDKLCSKLNLTLDLKKFKALYTIDKNTNCLIVKPQTFMNLSGEAVLSLANYYRINKDDIIIVYDDMDLAIGKIRIRAKGSSAGQKGMANIINHLNSSEIKRIRVGVGKNKLIDTKDYVLGKISVSEKNDFDIAIDKASDALISYLQDDFTSVMNNYNK